MNDRDKEIKKELKAERVKRKMKKLKKEYNSVFGDDEQ